MKKYAYTILILGSIVMLAGCSKNNNEDYVDEPTKNYNHTDSFVMLEPSQNEATLSAEDIEFDDPTVDLGEYFSEVYTEKAKEDDARYTNSTYVDFVINNIKSENNFTTVFVIDEWYDRAINAESYVVIFDDCAAYSIYEDSNNKVYSSEIDYQYYMEVNGYIEESED